MNDNICFENKKGLKLSGVLSNPTGNTEKVIVVLCHGFAGSKNSAAMVALEKELNEHEVSTLRFDFFGHGESEGKFEDITISQEVEDIFSAIEYLKSLGYIKIGLLGSSSGGGAVIMAAAKLPDLYAIALKAPAVDHVELEIAERGEDQIKNWKESGFLTYEKSSEEKFKLNYSFFEDLKNNIGYGAAEKISAPTLIVHGDVDTDVPIEQSIKLSKIIKNCHLEIFTEANHRFSKTEDFNRMINMISDFFIHEEIKIK